MIATDPHLPNLTASDQCHAGGDLPNLRLEIQLKLTIRQRFAQPSFQYRARCNNRLHLWVKKPQRIAAGGFRLIHGQIGTFQRLVYAFVFFAKQRNAYAWCAVVRVPTQNISLIQRHTNFFPNRFGLGRRF